MSKERPTLLTQAVAADFPSYSDIAVSFPDQWELIREIRAADTPLYIAALPHQEEPTRSDHFPELGPAINQALTLYRHYKTFLPWPQPRLSLDVLEAGGLGRVMGTEGLTIQLQPIGEAQAWYGGGYAVIWECYLFGSSLRESWLNELTAFWQAIETDIAAPTLFTEAREPDFPEGEFTYEDFLTTLGYTPLPQTPRWWQKLRTDKV